MIFCISDVGRSEFMKWILERGGVEVYVLLVANVRHDARTVFVVGVVDENCDGQRPPLPMKKLLVADVEKSAQDEDNDNNESLVRE